MRFPLRVAAAALVPVAALAFVLAAWGAPNRAAAPAKRADNPRLSPSCFPTNEFTVLSEFGPFGGHSSGAGSGTSSETGVAGSVKWLIHETVTGNTGGETPFSATVGSMKGELETVAHIQGWPKAIRFESTCIAEARVENDGDGDVLIEAEFQGTETGAPWGSGPAVASIVLSGDGSSASNFSFGLEQGTTCHETENEIAIAGGGHAWMNMNPTLASGEQRGRAGLPADVTPGVNPCSDVWLD